MHSQIACQLRKPHSLRSQAFANPVSAPFCASHLQLSCSGVVEQTVTEDGQPPHMRTEDCDTSSWRGVQEPRNARQEVKHTFPLVTNILSWHVQFNPKDSLVWDWFC